MCRSLQLFQPWGPAPTFSHIFTVSVYSVLLFAADLGGHSCAATVPSKHGQMPRSVSQSVILDGFQPTLTSLKIVWHPYFKKLLKKQALGMRTQISSVLEETQCPAVEEVSGSLSVTLLCLAWEAQG